MFIDNVKERKYVFIHSGGVVSIAAITRFVRLSSFIVLVPFLCDLITVLQRLIHPVILGYSFSLIGTCFWNKQVTLYRLVNIFKWNWFVNPRTVNPQMLTFISVTVISDLTRIDFSQTKICLIILKLDLLEDYLYCHFFKATKIVTLLLAFWWTNIMRSSIS